MWPEVLRRLRLAGLLGLAAALALVLTLVDATAHRAQVFTNDAQVAPTALAAGSLGGRGLADVVHAPLLADDGRTPSDGPPTLVATAADGDPVARPLDLTAAPVAHRDLLLTGASVDAAVQRGPPSLRS